MIAALALLLQVSQPRWTAFEDVRIGGSVDDVLGKGGECRPGDSGNMGPGMSAYGFAQMSFGYALPHYHSPSDSGAIRRALSVGTICWVRFDSTARGTVAAVDRRLVAMVIYLMRDSIPLPPDSARRLTYAAWGRPTHHSPTLDTWSGTRYRSYFLIPYVPASRASEPAWVHTPRLIVLDIAACTAFDRRAHRAGVKGEAGAC